MWHCHVWMLRISAKPSRFPQSRTNNDQIKNNKHQSSAFNNPRPYLTSTNAVHVSRANQISTAFTKHDLATTLSCDRKKPTPTIGYKQSGFITQEAGNMGTVCFIVDASVTGALLPRHLRAIRQTELAVHTLPIIVTGATVDPRLSHIEQRYQVHCLITPSQPLGARINQAAYVSQADWLLIAMQRQPLETQFWCLFCPQLEACTLDVFFIGSDLPRLSERLRQRFLGAATAVPPYIAIRRAWLERLGGLDPELDTPALTDLLRRLYACPTRLQAFSHETCRLAQDSSSTNHSLAPHHARPTH